MSATVETRRGEVEPGHWKIEVVVFDESRDLAEEIFDGIHDLICERWDVHDEDDGSDECKLDFSLGMGPCSFDEDD